MRPYSTLCHPEAGPHIGVRGDTLGHSALRRGIQKYRQDITQDTRAVRPYSTYRHLQKLDPASSAGDTVMFILLYSEKNEPRSAAAVIGLSRSEAGTALGGCGTRCAQTVLALIPQPAGLLPAR